MAEIPQEWWEIFYCWLSDFVTSDFRLSQGRGTRGGFATGNVTSTISDRKTPIDQNNDGTTDYFDPVVRSATEYYPFGLEMPGRTLNFADYRYGFNGKEADTNAEWGSLTHYDYGFRIYNPAIARFLSVDPLAPDYPSWTPYAFAMNRVIDGIDLDGLEYLRYEEAHVKINSGIVELRVENFNWLTQNLWRTAAQDPRNWNPGEIGLSRTVFSFELMKQNTQLPADLVSGISMDNSYTPSVDPTSHPYQQKVEGQRRPLTSKGDYDKRYKSIGSDMFVSSSPRATQIASRGTLVINGVIYGIKKYEKYMLGSTSDKVNEHTILARKALSDVNIAISIGLIKEEYVNFKNLSEIANYLLSGGTSGMSQDLVSTAKLIWEKVSYPVEIIESGLDNVPSRVIIGNLHNTTRNDDDEN